MNFKVDKNFGTRTHLLTLHDILLPMRRDMITLLTYLHNHKATGTQSTGNLPLKATTGITSQFVHPPELEKTVGELNFRIRSEEDVWLLYFLLSGMGE